jgi:putative membrane protein insertion efficiency factor
VKEKRGKRKEERGKEAVISPSSFLLPPKDLNLLPPRDSKRPSLVARGLLASISGYQKFLSPLKGAPTCRFYPTCSAYAFLAVQRHGAVKGTFLAVKRILKCQPLHPGGIDHVPD